MTTFRKDPTRPAPALAPGFGSSDAWQMLLGVAQAAQMVPAPTLNASRSIPFTLITGFLGAGKTTLVNHLLAGGHGIRLAVLVNDFGAINIDASLIRSRDGETLTLTNGCVCCSVAGGLTRTLLDLTERDDPPEAILLEASGVAEPNSIAHIALSNRSLRLDGVIAVLDGETVRRNAQDERFGCTVLRQIAVADVAIVNKCDLLSDEEVAELKAWLGETAKRCRVVEAVQAKVPAEAVLGLELPASRFGSSGESVFTADHADNFRSWSFTYDSPLDSQRLIATIPNLPSDIIRAKGVLWLSDDPEYRNVLQCVGDRWVLERGDAWEASEARKSMLVLIGLDGCAQQAELDQQFTACLVGVGQQNDERLEAI